MWKWPSALTALVRVVPSTGAGLHADESAESIRQIECLPGGSGRRKRYGKQSGATPWPGSQHCPVPTLTLELEYFRHRERGSLAWRC